MSLPEVFIATLENAFNQYLSLDPEALPRFESMEGKVIGIEILGLNESVYLFPGADGIMVMSDFDGEADATISGSPVALAKLGVAVDAASIMFSGEVKISGDTRLGNQFKKILSQLNIDWEEQLSNIVGDVAAHQVGNAVRSFSKWFKRSKQSLELDVGEYLQEESRLIPTNAELNKFIKDVDVLREGVDRLQAHIDRLKNKQ